MRRVARVEDPMSYAGYDCKTECVWMPPTAMKTSENANHGKNSNGEDLPCTSC